MVENNPHQRSGRNKFLTALIAIIALVAMTAISSGSSGEWKETAVQAAATTARCEDKEEPKKEAKEPGIGDPVRDGKFEFTVTKVIPGVEEVGDAISRKPQGQFILACMDVENIGDKAQLFDGSAQKLFDSKDREFSADTLAAVYLDESESFLNEINPGNKVEGVVVFDVPKNVKPVKMELHDSLFSDGVTVYLGA